MKFQSQSTVCPLSPTTSGVDLRHTGLVEVEPGSYTVSRAQYASHSTVKEKYPGSVGNLHQHQRVENVTRANKATLTPFMAADQDFEISPRMPSPWDPCKDKKDKWSPF